MSDRRQLIVNADDFGQSPGVNRGVIEAHERGIVTSASLMVRWPAAETAAAYARHRRSLSVGLHVDLGEWAYRDGAWQPLYAVVPLDDERAVAAELSRQLASFHVLFGGPPSHLDSHQHVHRAEPVRSLLGALAEGLGIPLRGECAIGYCGRFYGQTGRGDALADAISVHGLLGILRQLPPGVTELGCHPGYGDDLDTMYRAERECEVQTLCDPRVRRALETEGIELRSFREPVAGGARG